MPRRKRNVQYNAAGCKVCGDPDVGRGIVKHLQGAHGLKLSDYKKCFDGGKSVVNKLIETGTASGGKKRVIMHVMVRRFLIPA